MKVLVLDGTEKSNLFSAVEKVSGSHFIEYSNNADRAVAKIDREKYDLFILSSAPGRNDLYDVSKHINDSNSSKRAGIVIIGDNPTKSHQIGAEFRGRQVFTFTKGNFEEAVSLIERILS